MSHLPPPPQGASSTSATASQPDAAPAPNTPPGVARYSAACSRVVEAIERVIETANHAVRAREMSVDSFQHEISQRHFAELAAEKERAFVPLYKDFVAACKDARSQANLVRADADERDLDPEFLILIALDPEDYQRVDLASHLLRHDFQPTASGFIADLATVNEAIQADIYNYGEDGFLGVIYSEPAPEVSDEQTCPWCAETIKAAAIICRYCNREVAPAVQPDRAGDSATST